MGVSEGKNFNVTIVVNVVTNEFTLTGTGVIADTRCGALTLRQNGIRNRTGSILTVDECWNK